jgi:hypothetical protein
MARDILGDYGPESKSGSRASNGGQVPVRDVRNYAPPQGPTDMMRKGPGLGGTNLGNCGTQCRSAPGPKTSGMPRSDNNMGNRGTQRKG